MFRLRIQIATRTRRGVRRHRPPIVVGKSFEFSIDELITRYRAEPRVVTGGSTRFVPCVCLAPDPASPRDPGPAIAPGPYLIVIEPQECPEGEAKVYGEICATTHPVHCEADGWRGGFGLTLVRFPADPPEDESIRTPWDLRGILSAYYFDVFEHSLIDRWDTDFARDEAFCEGTGPHLHQAEAVPLAMVYIGRDGASVCFLDPWIPRRTLAATSATSWTKNMIGAPTPAASMARIHQFQCMLAQILKKASLIPPDPASGTKGLNLFDRGFRHIPPCGFLPIDPAAQVREPFGFPGSLQTSAVTAGFQLGNLSGNAELAPFLVTQAISQASLYFKGTTIFPYFVVAPHSDDCLEDFNNAFDKDPVVVEGASTTIDEIESNALSSTTRYWKNWEKLSIRTNPIANFISIFHRITAALFDNCDLANREVGIVKVIIPLQGRGRKHPILGKVAADSDSTLREWLAPNIGDQTSFTFDPKINRFARSLKIDCLPRHFVVYVKQRVVLLDAIYILLEHLKNVEPYFKRRSGMDWYNIRDIRDAFNQKDASQRAVIIVALKTPLVREITIDSFFIAHPELANPEMWKSFFIHLKQLKELEAEDVVLSPTVGGLADRRIALEKLVEGYSDEYEGFRTLNALLAILDPDSGELYLRGIKRVAEERPLLDKTGKPKGEPVGRILLHGNAIRIFASDDERHLWRVFKTSLDNRKINEIFPDIGNAITIKELRGRSQQEAESVLGNAKVFETVKGTINRRIDPIAKSIPNIVNNSALDTLSGRFHEQLVTTEGDAAKAFMELQREFGKDPVNGPILEQVRPMVDILGPEGFASVAALIFKPGAGPVLG